MGTYKKYIEPVVAIGILLFLILNAVQLYQDSKIQKEISQTCGWETEKKLCYCEKKFIDDVKLRMEESISGEVSLDGISINP